MNVYGKTELLNNKNLSENVSFKKKTRSGLDLCALD